MSVQPSASARRSMIRRPVLRCPGSRSIRGGATASPPFQVTVISAGRSPVIRIARIAPDAGSAASGSTHWPPVIVTRRSTAPTGASGTNSMSTGGPSLVIRTRRSPPARVGPPRISTSASLAHAQAAHGRLPPVGRQLGREARPPVRSVGIPAEDAAQQRGRQHRAGEELVRHRLVERLVERARKEFAVAAQAPVVGHLLDRVHQVEARPRTTVAVLGPGQVAGHERPDGPHVVREGVVEVALRGEHVRAPVRGQAVARHPGQRAAGALLVQQPERGGRGRPHRQIVVGAAVFEDGAKAWWPSPAGQ